MGKFRAVLFDFDGTISTLRAGWECIMAPFMKEEIAGSRSLSAEEEERLDRDIAAYIDQSTGIQTIYQMQWLADKVRSAGWNETVKDEWAYKAVYNSRLLEQVMKRVDQLASGQSAADDYLIKGAADFIRTLHSRGLELYVASGTDHPDVVREAEVLGVAKYFRAIAGAPVGKADCSKEKVLRELMHDKGLAGHELAVIGDGKVEIRLAKEAGSLALGLASDEEARTGIHPVKKQRLMAAGADWIAGDFVNTEEWLKRLGL
ncbi:HAD family hydrolase [Paenibacillus sp. H1-7]|uniref:HAD family hydrolase n=1 Tax=Paenibacillus sp. H1-7 TaxID=2282849 RepID=UPI001EF95BA2|nr:HAD family hydrolase [Paenibacillus sp. H1-7]